MILDGIVIIFIVLSAVAGYKKGLSTILISLIGFVAAITLAFMFKSSLANYVIEKTDIEISMKEAVSTGIEKAIQTKTSETTGNSNNTFYTSLIKNMGVDETVDNLSNNVVKFIMETAAFVLIFFIVNICAFMIQMIFNVVFELPILNSINNFGGFGLGIIMALFKVWIILALISMFIPMFGQLKTLIDSSMVTKMLYDINIITKLLSSGLKI